MSMSTESRTETVITKAQKWALEHGAEEIHDSEFKSLCEEMGRFKPLVYELGGKRIRLYKAANDYSEPYRTEEAVTPNDWGVVMKIAAESVREKAMIALRKTVAIAQADLASLKEASIAHLCKSQPSIPNYYSIFG
jgi:hypothetical protein